MDIKICVLFHIFNIEVFKEIISEYYSFFSYKYLYISCTTDTLHKKNIIADIWDNFNTKINYMITICTENRGADIGGLLTNLKILKDSYKQYE